MDNKTKAEPGVKDTTVQDPGKKESDMNESNQQDVEQTADKKKPKKSENKEKRPAINAKERYILDFLRGCSPYEADAIRVMTSFATGKGEVGGMSEADRKALNDFLNFGVKATTNTAKDCKAQRIQNAAKLLQDLKDFLDKEQYVRANIALLTIAPDEKAIDEAVRRTPTRTEKDLFQK